jgi:hypothetical protein
LSVDVDKLGHSFLRPFDKTDEELREEWDAKRAAIVANSKDRVKKEGKRVTKRRNP